jgi:hypothetical protein
MERKRVITITDGYPSITGVVVNRDLGRFLLHPVVVDIVCEFGSAVSSKGGNDIEIIPPIKSSKLGKLVKAI